MNKKPEGRLSGITDNEAFVGAAHVDNCFHYHFKLYVRWERNLLQLGKFLKICKLKSK